ncbi:hypothetical protein [Streptosporangium sp. NPDC087985]|uniref:hypothetical protein n=1 Tax=Streptosporangium sp. NPDC087985 TaxID=3366196 RepID=UPI00382502D1
MAVGPDQPLAAEPDPPSESTSKPPGTKASTVITVTGLGVVSLLLISYCAAQNDYEEVGADCVDLGSGQADGSYTVVDDDYCDDSSYHGSHGAYRWYYGGMRSGVRMGGGTLIRPSDVNITSHRGTVIQRGGFGGHGGWHGGS